MVRDGTGVRSAMHGPMKAWFAAIFFSSENMPSTSLCVKKEYYYSMGIQPYSSYGHTAVLFIWAYSRTLHTGIQPSSRSYLLRPQARRWSSQVKYKYAPRNYKITNSAMACLHIIYPLGLATLFDRLPSWCVGFKPEATRFRTVRQASAV